jgi:anti-sigma B factor antagonist
MNIETRSIVDVDVLSCRGNLTIGSGDEQLRDAVKGLLGQGRAAFVLNLTEVPYMDSSGLGELVATYKRAAERKGTVKLVLNPRGKELIGMLRLHLVFEVFSDLDQALASFGIPEEERIAFDLLNSKSLHP